jgi:hypothetical protein
METSIIGNFNSKDGNFSFSPPSPEGELMETLRIQVHPRRHRWNSHRLRLKEN